MMSLIVATVLYSSGLGFPAGEHEMRQVEINGSRIRFFRTWYTSQRCVSIPEEIGARPVVYLFLPREMVNDRSGPDFYADEMDFESASSA